MILRMDEHRDQRGWDILEGATGHQAFDIGANIGQSTRVLARGFTAVVALEPCWESFDILEQEMPVNVTPLRLAAADHAGELVLDEAERSLLSGQLVTGEGLPMWGERKGTRTVACVTVDQLTDTYGRPDFIKVDTEGGEVSVLRGAARTLAEHRPRLLVEMHRAEHDEPVREMLAGYHLTELRHGSYVRPGGPTYLNHYWLVCEP